MAWLLAIESATQVCSVALSHAGETRFLRETHEPNAHSRLLAGFVRELMDEAGLAMPDLGGVVVSKGPGSYTGLRIGVSTAKGLCYGLGIPLIAVPTLEGMALGALAQAPPGTLLCPMIDARRMEVYTALYNPSMETVMETRAQIVEEKTFQEYLDQFSILFFGSGADKCREVIRHPNASFNTSLHPSAGHLSRIGWERFTARAFEDVAYFEPYYLKDFVAAKPRVKGLFE
ncbi:MAG TPA: tRNA (adenosine(37)-N6)-threonylcarbamoyltransferase complex dimerization subunit type 1 TsaB [Bacteroidales bacterium]|nr:tRNA (adenosine(37)-N6)-threonylcarbamoyltransferase complex dimerization subunit type 1 TsaB [Bacteroidales bacterium]HRZ75975.1 tRNA (adenosine(37)-N6)-threonylcarbamoyltransferase complex dimerization subunit type 1 TsaB [Bacteroidales bacterium]